VSQKTFYGKYRGKVENNFDPDKLGRIQVSVPTVLGSAKSWAMPCVPYAGPKVGLFTMPPKGASVWIEFEGGDPDYPIWSGCFWGPNQLPETATAADKKVFKSEGISLICDDTANKGGFTLQVTKPAISSPISITLDSDGIRLSNQRAEVKLTAKTIEIDYNQAKLNLNSSDASLVLNGTQMKLSQVGLDIKAKKIDVS